MRRSLATRVFAATVAAWFGFLTIQPLYVAPCPHHQLALAELAQGLSIAAGAGHSMVSAGSESHEMADMSAGDAHSMHNMPGHNGPGSHQCRCLGAMCGSAPVGLAQSVARVLPAAITARMEVAAMPPVAHAPNAAPPHTLPFATAPPALLLA